MRSSFALTPASSNRTVSMDELGYPVSSVNITSQCWDGSANRAELGVCCSVRVVERADELQKKFEEVRHAKPGPSSLSAV